MKSKEEILKYISEIEIKKEPEWTNTIKNNLMVFYSWLLEKNYLHELPSDEDIESMFFDKENLNHKLRIEGAKHLRDVLSEEKKSHY